MWAAVRTAIGGRQLPNGANADKLVFLLSGASFDMTVLTCIYIDASLRLRSLFSPQRLTRTDLTQALQI